VSAPATSPLTAHADSGELNAPAGQIGLFIVVVGLLVLGVARWLLDHTWVAATVAALVLGTVAVAVFLVLGAADLRNV